MGARSMNYIALKPGVLLGEAIKLRLHFKRLAENACRIMADARGTLIVYESNFSPMWARDVEKGGYVRDLEEELELQKFLGTLSKDQFYMKRAGADYDWRGAWLTHPYGDEQDVKEIDASYQAGVGEYQEGFEVKFSDDYTVRVELSITASSPEEAAQLALNDLRDTSMFDWNMDVSSSRGTKTVSVDAADAPAMA